MNLQIPRGEEQFEADCDGYRVPLSNLNKIFFPEVGKTKRDLLQYYADIGPALIPHLQSRANVMKRYPNGVTGEFFFMKRAPAHRPEWIVTCSIEHRSGNIIDFPVANDLASLLWLVNLGCIDMNPWYARCDDVNRPDFLHFDLDPVEPAGFGEVCRVALRVRDYLEARTVSSSAKTTGSRGIHVYVAIERGPLQKEVWKVAKATAIALAKEFPDEITSEYRIAKRPAGRVLVDYNQNAWGSTLASVYSVRAKPCATVSTPLSWQEIENGVDASTFTIDSVPQRVEKLGDLFAPLLASDGRCSLSQLT